MPLAALMAMRTPVKLPGPVVTARAVMAARRQLDQPQQILERGQQVLRLAAACLPGQLGQQLAGLKIVEGERGCGGGGVDCEQHGVNYSREARWVC